jgi:RNA polymerase sigma-70 factor (ECF subfamily)
MAVSGGRAQPGRGGRDGGGPAVALAEVETLERDGRLTGYRYLPAIKADFLRRLGRESEAATEYRQAITLSGNDAERAFLIGRLTDRPTR